VVAVVVVKRSLAESGTGPTQLISGGGRRGQEEADRPERSELRSSSLDADERPELAVCGRWALALLILTAAVCRRGRRAARS
jgi:hypothetical protein